MAFPSDIKGSMKSCILKIFWPKDDIVSFFSDNGCTKKDMAILGNHKELSRSNIISTMFDHLSSKHDEGLGQFRSMLQSLQNWDHFDSYYFDQLKKLKMEDALTAIGHLKQLQEIRDYKIKSDRAKREQKEKDVQSPKKTLEELKKSFLSLFNNSISNADRGYKLEKLLLELCRLSSLEITEPFRVNGEQIDGSVNSSFGVQNLGLRIKSLII
ncbi:MAG: hypothetical protein L3J98_00205 [Gammaproteobacteria bacterium]|nr:hypothetical protein [Gammaproteobacteria bacterium]